MSTKPASDAPPADAAVRALHRDLLDAWNRRDAADFAALFESAGHAVGFDGSAMNGQVEIAKTLAAIFADHPTASYVAKVREVRFPTVDTAILRAVAGMVPRGQSALNPAVNAVQTVVAVHRGDTWKIALFQNTPAQYHGRPDLAEALTEELRRLV